jgi:hypothetical protein
MSPDWREWHEAYDRPDTPLSQRLAIVQQCIRDALDAAPAGPFTVVSMCAGEARDLAGVLADHPRAADVHGRVVELDPELCERARAGLGPRIEVLCADAGLSDAYEDAVPANLVLVCGVFGNITDVDMENTLAQLPTVCAPGAVVVWTRHRREPDMTVKIREWLADLDFEELLFTSAEESMFGVGAHRFRGVPQPFRPHVRLFEFLGYDTLTESCKECGYSYDVGRTEVLGWLRSDTDAFVERLAAIDDDAVRVRPAPGVWSPLEYACHVRDVLQVQRGRVRQALDEDEPAFTPMGRDERAVERRYNHQDPQQVQTEIQAAGEAFRTLLEGLDDAGWRRRGLYNYPTPELRTVEWIGVHTVHELFHHRRDLSPS